MNARLAPICKRNMESLFEVVRKENLIFESRIDVKMRCREPAYDVRK